jgi:tRNA A-37 threonylcarbamoyl transferase component Bud32
MKKDPSIIIPGAEFMSKEELRKARKNETQRRLMNKRRGVEVEKTTKQVARKIDTAQMVELSKDTRNLAVQILNDKLVQMQTDPEALAKTSIKDLATVFGILVDKSQLLNGLATSNIAIHAKIDVNMTSDKALEELNRMREKYAEGNE